jgi:dihydroorotase
MSERLSGSENNSWVIKGGTIYDGSGGAALKGDVTITDGIVSGVGVEAGNNDGPVFDATGLIVTPGIIDLHVHVYDGMNIHSVAPADAGLKTGVTTMLDLGSAGASNYGTFHKYVIPSAQETVFALLNISMFGVQGHPDIPPCQGDLHDVQHFDVGSAVKMIDDHRDRLLGVKVRLTDWLADMDIEKERAALAAAIAVRDQTGLPLYVHHVRSALSLDEVLSQLQAGDVLTHPYQGLGNGGFTGPDGAPCAALTDARERGVLFDVGHGNGCFWWHITEPACQIHNFWPDEISSDLHIFNLNGPVIDMPTTMSKFLHLGQPLEQVIYCSTLRPAEMMGKQAEYGLLAAGRAADVTIFKLEEGQHSLIDSGDVERIATHRLVPVAVFKNGVKYECQVDYAAQPAVAVTADA